jgi:hypothetical protein
METETTYPTKVKKQITPRDILRFKTINPNFTIQETAAALEVPTSSVRGVMNSSAGRILMEEIGKDSLMLLADIRRKALARVNQLLNEGGMPLKEEILLLRLILTPVVNDKQTAHEKPKLIFQTTITPRGTIDRTVVEDLSEMDDLPTIEGEVSDEISDNLDAPLNQEY